MATETREQVAPDSPLPWSLGPSYDPNDTTSRAVLNAKGGHVCDNEPYYPEPVSIADMRYIVHTANCYPDLLAALKELREFTIQTLIECDEYCEPGCVFCRARDVINKAEGRDA